MPEGDTLALTARTLARRLEGRALVRCESEVASVARRDDLVGRTVSRVHAYGKYLLIELAPQAPGEETLALRTHLRMNGTWHVYRPGERYMLPAWRARLVLEVEGTVAVCFSAPLVELLSLRAAEASLDELGPNLLDETFDLETALANLAAHDGPLGVAVMDQRVVAGIGNVYKAEVLFLCRLDPFARVRDVERAKLREVLETARRLLVQNSGPEARRRRTRKAPGPAHWVYERSGSPCLVCGAKVAMRRQGALGRSTYFCPTCQRSQRE